MFDIYYFLNIILFIIVFCVLFTFVNTIMFLSVMAASSSNIKKKDLFMIKLFTSIIVSVPVYYYILYFEKTFGYEGFYNSIEQENSVS